MFLLFVVGEEDPVWISWILLRYLPHVAGIVAGGFQFCPILCLCIVFDVFRCTVVVRSG